MQTERKFEVAVSSVRVRLIAAVRRAAVTVTTVGLAACGDHAVQTDPMAAKVPHRATASAIGTTFGTLAEIGKMVAVKAASQAGSASVFDFMSSTTSTRDHSVRGPRLEALDREFSDTKSERSFGTLLREASASSGGVVVLTMPVARHRATWRRGDAVQVVVVDPSSGKYFAVSTSGEKRQISKDVPPDAPTLVIRLAQSGDHQQSLDAAAQVAECEQAVVGALGSVCEQRSLVGADIARPAIIDPCEEDPTSEACVGPPPPPPVRPAPGMYVREVRLTYANVSCGWSCPGSSNFNIYAEVPSLSGTWTLYSCTGRTADWPWAPAGLVKYYADMWGNSYTSSYGSGNGMLLSASDIERAQAFYQEDVAAFRFEIWSDDVKGSFLNGPSFPDDYPNCNVDPEKPDAPEKTAKDLYSTYKAFSDYIKVIQVVQGVKKFSINPVIGLAIFALNQPGPRKNDDLYGDLVLEDTTRTPTQYGYALTFRIKSKYLSVRQGDWIETSASFDNGYAKIEVIESP